MSGYFLLDWAALALSLFNTSLLLWLGLTVLLNAERRTAARAAWGTWLVAGSLLLGGLFFISHSALLNLDLNAVGRGLNFWWRLGWWPVLALPLAWYHVVLWYSGYWDEPDSPLRRRQRRWPWVAAALLAGLVALVVLDNPVPTLGGPAASPALAIGEVPLLLIAYPIYIVLCVWLALDALLRPGPTHRVMGSLARRRARPWLAAASLVLLAVSLLVAWVLVEVGRALAASGVLDLTPGAPLTLSLAAFDVVVTSLLAVAILLLGQALVTYEVFTGKALPRRGLVRYWRSAVWLAGGYGLAAGFTLALSLRPIYSVLFTTLLLSGFYALIAWRAFVERERYMRQLRPFVTSQRLYDHLLAHASAEGADLAGSFRALCRDVLGTRRAGLFALGPAATLAGPPLTYAEAGQAAPDPPAAALAEIAARAASPESLLLPASGEAAGFDDSGTGSPPAGALWAVPLWSDRGLTGLLLLGDKSDGGLYTQEEIEIARAAGERLIDTQASAELARRLLALQRQRLAESQVLDRRARRVIHDDVLPQLHAALLRLPPGPPDGDARPLLAGIHRQLSDLLRAMPATPPPEVASLGLVPALRGLLEGEMAHAFDSVTWQAAPEAERLAAGLPPLSAEVVFYAAREVLRNAARYARQPQPEAPLRVRLDLACEPGPAPPARPRLRLTVEDNGPGFDRVNASTHSPHGTGEGLALHSTLLAAVGGELRIEREGASGGRVTLVVPGE